MKIVCTKCGEVEKYGILEKCHQTLIFNAKHEPCGATELYDDKLGKPRCLICNRLVKFIEDKKEK